MRSVRRRDLEPLNAGQQPAKEVALQDALAVEEELQGGRGFDSQPEAAARRLGGRAQVDDVALRHPAPSLFARAVVQLEGVAERDLAVVHAQRAPALAVGLAAPGCREELAVGINLWPERGVELEIAVGGERTEDLPVL